VIRDVERERRRRNVVSTTVVLALCVGAAGYLLGVAWLQILLLITGVTTVGAACVALGSVDDDPDLPPLDQAGVNTGTRREVSRLSWVLAGHDNRVGGVPYRRLRAIAVNRLSLRGIDVSDPAGDEAARELLGEEGYRLLIAETNATPSQRQFVDCITLLERLDGLDPETSRPGAGPSAPGGSDAQTTTVRSTNP
jgi:hypothetical protein